jgi:hypothetical protein
MYPAGEAALLATLDLFFRGALNPGDLVATESSHALPDIIDAWTFAWTLIAGTMEPNSKYGAPAPSNPPNTAWQGRSWRRSWLASLAGRRRPSRERTSRPPQPSAWKR